MTATSSVVFLITGASKGLGKAIATVAGKHNTNHNVSGTKAKFLLVARSFDGLQTTRRDIRLATKGLEAERPASENHNDDILCRSIDLSNLDRLDSSIDDILNDLNRLCSNDDRENHRQKHHQQHLVLVNNAANLGHLGPSLTSPSLEDMRQTIDLNVTSSLWLSVRFARYVRELQEGNKGQQSGNPTSIQGTLVNISSLVALSDDFCGMGIYSAGKAAREMYHSVMAKEVAATEESSPESVFKILNYAPGPLETRMTQEIRSSESLDEDLQSQFQKPLLDPEDSARKLIRLLDKSDFESGSHIDYYDLPNNMAAAEES